MRRRSFTIFGRDDGINKRINKSASVGREKSEERREWEPRLRVCGLDSIGEETSHLVYRSSSRIFNSIFVGNTEGFPWKQSNSQFFRIQERR